MQISAISFYGLKNPSKTVSKVSSAATKSIPSEEELLSKIKQYWQMVNEDPLNAGWFNKLTNAESLLKKNYPKAFDKYKKEFNLR